MPNRFTPEEARKNTEALICGHPNTNENTMRLGNLVMCITCKFKQLWIPGHWEPKKTAWQTKAKAETAKSDSIPTPSGEKVTVVE